MNFYHAINSTLGRISGLIENDRKLQGRMKNLLQEVMQDMRMMNTYIEKEEGSKLSSTPEEWMQELQNLAYDMEDFKDLLGQKTKGKLPWRLLRMVMNADSRPLDIGTIESFMERCASLKSWLDRFRMVATPQSGRNDHFEGNPTLDSLSFSFSESPSRTSSSSNTSEPIISMDKAVGELSELLNHDDGQPARLRVVSIVGCRGLGKTTLAREVYNKRQNFDYQAFVSIIDGPSRKSNNNAANLLKEILSKVCRRTADNGNGNNVKRLREILVAALEGKRYFFVIDDLRGAEVWRDMEPAFPNNTDSIIIVTTSVQSVAMACSSGSNVYKLERLDLDYSKKVLWRNVYDTADDPNLHPVLDRDSTDIMNKCDGLPLAVISVARYLKCKGNIQGNDCKWLANNLAGRLASDEGTPFQELRRVLDECYDGLSSYDLKTCLLSVSVFPYGHKIKGKSLARRWIAEGFVPQDAGLNQNDDDTAQKGLAELLDNSIMEPTPSSSIINMKPEAKRCQVHGVMLEFLVGKSGSKNFVNLIKNGKLLKKKEGWSVRRLSIHETGLQDSEDTSSRGDALSDNVGDVSHIRSLTIVGNKKSLVDFHGCKLMRVLDLENCRGVDNAVLRNICKLSLLKYLSLRGTDARRIPRGISKLRDLVTLDVRDLQTVEVITLPLQVILLPRLAHLFGVFHLPTGLNVSKPHMRAASRLQTLAGFVIRECEASNKNNISPDFKYILDHMKKLKKVKIWWKSASAPSADLTKLLVDSLKGRLVGSISLDDSLSLDFGDHSLDFLGTLVLEADSTLDSIKLRGKLIKLPCFITTSLRHLSEVHVASTGLHVEELSEVQKLPYLKYLKIVESNEFGNGNLHVLANGFPALMGLFVKTPKLPEVLIDNGGMRHLTTLQLLCDDIDGFKIAYFSQLQHLDKVLLVSSLPIGKQDAWNAGAKNNDNRPRIDYLPSSAENNLSAN